MSCGFILCHFCFVFLFASFNVLVKESVQYGCYRNGDKHSANTQQGAAYGNRRQNQPCRKANGLADHLGEYKVALQLLQDDEEYNEEQSLNGRYSKYHKRANTCGDECARYRDKSHKCNQRTDHSRIRETEDEHAQHTQSAKNNSFGTLAYNVLAVTLISSSSTYLIFFRSLGFI